MTKDLTRGDPFRVLLQFSLPVIGGNLFQLFYTLADSVIVGRVLGAGALAAVGSTSILIHFVLCFIQGFTGGFGIRLGQACGAQDEAAQRRCAAVSWALSAAFAVGITLPACALAGPVLRWMQTPADIAAAAHEYLFIVLLGSGATIFYNIIANLLRALGDSKTPLVFLIVSALLNVGLDFLFILPCGMGVGGAAWATVLSQLISAMLCTAVGMRRFAVLRTRRADFAGWRQTAAEHLRIGLPMGFQMSIMCIGQLAMQAAVNTLGSAAVAGYTAATKMNQLAVLLNNAFGLALSSYVAQNYGARRYRRIRQGVRASLLQTLSADVCIGALLTLGGGAVAPLFLEQPTAEITGYAAGFLHAVAPFYFVLGLLLVFRSAVQSMGNTGAPFAACVIELVMRIAGTFGLSQFLGYTGVCLASPLAWAGAVALLIPVYRREIAKYPAGEPEPSA